MKQIQQKNINKTSEKRKIRGRYVWPPMGKLVRDASDHLHACTARTHVVVHLILGWVVLSPLLTATHAINLARCSYRSHVTHSHDRFFLVRQATFRSNGLHGKCMRMEIGSLRCACMQKILDCKAPSEFRILIKGHFGWY